MLNVLGEGKAKCKSLLNFHFIFKCIHLDDNSILLLDSAISTSIVSPVVVRYYCIHNFLVAHHLAIQFRQVHNWEIHVVENMSHPTPWPFLRGLVPRIHGPQSMMLVGTDGSKFRPIQNLLGPTILVVDIEW
mmetsp:Transcript_11341/g.20860  ORF Transcript_11341/g.20860 Transcript_11341/m.20860 type:complete len:132 (-) Transcript_11341:511-906(-)